MLIKILVGALGLCFLALGGAKLAGVSAIRAAFDHLRLPRWSRYGIGVAELLLGLAMVASAFQPFLTFFAAIPLLAIALGAIGLHLVRGPKRAWLPASVLAVATVAAALLQPLGLQVMSLPKPDVLPERPVAGRTLQTFAAGDAFEGVAVAPDGSVWMTRNRGVNYQSGDTTGARSDLLRRLPDGSTSVMASLPAGTTGGMLAFAQDGSFYFKAGGRLAGVWQGSANGHVRRIAAAPAGAWLNGIDFGPDGKLYSADSLLGLIWRIDPATGTITRAAEDASLLRRPFLAIIPGGNGIHFRGRDAIVTNSDRGTVLSTELRSDGSFAKPRVIATGVPGDDFAVTQDGALLVTTHPYNTVVRIELDGSRAIIATAAQGVTGAVAAALGHGDAGRRALYVVTDGGALGGVSGARGALIRLSL
jgi:sugar lactone lactonase YvrE